MMRSTGVVLAAEKRVTSKLLDVRKTSEKMYKVDDHVSYVFHLIFPCIFIFFPAVLIGSTSPHHHPSAWLSLVSRPTPTF
jgi:hypothetical protein